MAVRHILQVENPEELKTLKSKAVRVTKFDAALRQLAEDMIETMRDASGVGLAAPQIGLLRRIVVIEEPAEVEEQEDGTTVEIRPSQLYVMVNPEIIKASEEKIPLVEGCLSLPGRYGEVERHAWVTIKYQDLDGKEQRIRHAEAQAYRVGHIAQHEIDHLDGVLFTERLTDINTLRDYRREERPRRRWLRRGKQPVEVVEEE